MDRDAEHDQSDAGDVLNGRNLAQDDRADDGGEHRQQRQHERERGPGQPCHRQLICDVRNHRRAHADSGPGQQQDGMPESRQSAAQAPRRRRDRRDAHGRPEPVDTARPRPLGAGHGDPVAEDDVQHEQPAVGEGEDKPERVPGDADRGDGKDTRGR